MKHILINNPNVVRSENIGTHLLEDLKKSFEKKSIELEGLEFCTDISNPMTDDQEIILETVKDYIYWVQLYFSMILHKNETAIEKKQGNFKTFVSAHIDTQNRKGKLYFYLSGEVFGLVVGSSYSNITALIKSSFPIFSKMDLDIEIKIFSLQDETTNIF
ncbi:MAG: hypothetical protein WC511_01610 [Candidatus Pacearchaeota archaeon]